MWGQGRSGSGSVSGWEGDARSRYQATVVVSAWSTEVARTPNVEQNAVSSTTQG